MAFISATCEPLRIWSRLEPRTRQLDFADSLAARIADPAFMLGRQWQFGEFAGTDAGSAVFATLARQVSPVRLPDADPDVGCDPIAEQLPIEFPLVVRARLGRTLLRRLDVAVIGSGVDPADYDAAALRRLFGRSYGPLDPEPTDPVAAARDRTAPRAVRARHALRGRCVDGVRAYELTPPDLTAATLPADLTSGLPAGMAELVVGVLLDFREWFERTFLQPPPGDGSRGDRWEGDQLEYAVAGVVERGATTVEVEAAEHQGGHLDWYSFDQGASAPASDGSEAALVDVRSVIPVPAEFPGMPRPRWWQFEDGAVDLGKLSADATDAARIVVSEFALLFSNDWFTVVCRQPVGSVAELQGVVVTDTFGWRTLVQPTVAPAGEDWTGWDAFSLAPRPSGPSQAPLPQHLYLPSTLPLISDSEALEEVVFVRDETADMVWAIEQRVRDGLDGSRDAADASRRMRRQLDPEADAAPTPGQSTSTGLRYVVQTEVAENWIPFVPVHLPGQLRAIQLQRGTLRRTIGSADTMIRPRTSILREGIDASDQRVAPYFVHEQEVSRAGVRVQGLLRRARAYDGTPVVWHARRVTTGRGEARSGLAFDRVVDA